MSIWNSPTLGKNLGVLRTANSITQRHTDYKMSFSGGQVSWNANPDTDFTVASGSQHSNSSELRTLKFCLFRIELTWELFSWLLFGLVFAVIQVKFCFIASPVFWQCSLNFLDSIRNPLIFAQKVLHDSVLMSRHHDILHVYRIQRKKLLTRVPVDRRKDVFILQACNSI